MSPTHLRRPTRGLAALLLVSVAFAAPTAPTSAQVPAVRPAAALTDAEISRIDAAFVRFGNASPGAALAVVRDGEIVYEAGYGLANLEYGVPITPASTFHVASVSKQFAAMAVVLLALEGRVDLDASIREYVPEVPDFGPTITVRHLLNHTSGMRDQWSLLSMAGWRGQDIKTQDDVLWLISRQRDLNFEPGAEYLYSNSGFTLMAILVERVTGQPMKDFARERIFEPLGMTSTHFHDDMGHIVPGRTYAYSPTGGGFRINIPFFANYGATSLFTNVRDLARWANNLESKTVGGEAGIAMLLERGVLNSGEAIGYALGIQHGAYRGLTTVGHSGSDAGYRAEFRTYPDQRTAIIVLSNVSNGNPGGLARAVADVVLEDAFPPAPEQQGGGGGGDTEREPDPPPPTLSEAQLREFVGTYHSVELDVDYVVALEGGRLFLQRRKFGDRELEPEAEDTFDAGSTYRFVRDATGSVVGFEVTSGRVRNLRFERR